MSTMNSIIVCFQREKKMFNNYGRDQKLASQSLLTEKFCWNVAAFLCLHKLNPEIKVVVLSWKKD